LLSKGNSLGLNQILGWALHRCLPFKSAGSN
jgi:hypothetical protein